MSAPLLLFPTQLPQATAVALGLLLLVWVGETALRRPWPTSPFNGALLLLLGMVLAGILVSPYPDLTLPKATGIVLGLGLFRWTAGLREPKARRLSLVLLLLAAVAVWALGFLGMASSHKIAVLRDWIERLPAGIVSLPDAPEGGVSPNQLGGVLALLLPLPVALAVQGRFSLRSLPRRLPVVLLASAWVATLALTQSRSGWVGGLAGLLTLAVLAGVSAEQGWQRRAGIALLLLVLAAMATLLVWWGPDRVGEFFYGISQGRTETAVGQITVQGRLEIWSRAFYAIQDFPFTGCGLGAFRQVVWVLYPLFTIPLETDIAHAHNAFLQVALDLGLPGLVAYLALLGVAGAIGWRVARRGGEDRWLALGLLSGLVGCHIYGLTDALALGSRPHFLAWWMLGLLAALAGQQCGQRRPQAVGKEGD